MRKFGFLAMATAMALGMGSASCYWVPDWYCEESPDGTPVGNKALGDCQTEICQGGKTVSVYDTSDNPKGGVCSSGPHCGNGMIDPGEACDDGLDLKNITCDRCVPTNGISIALDPLAQAGACYLDKNNKCVGPSGSGDMIQTLFATPIALSLFQGNRVAFAVFGGASITVPPGWEATSESKKFAGTSLPSPAKVSDVLASGLTAFAESNLEVSGTEGYYTLIVVTRTQ